MSRRLFKYIDTKVAPKVFCGTILELGPARTWAGQRLLKQNTQLELVGVGFSQEQRSQALQQAEQWGIRTRVTYQADTLPTIAMADKSVDAVISFGGLHTWDAPMHVFEEIQRVLKVEGNFFIGDVRKDAAWWQIPWMAGRNSETKEIYKKRKTAMKATDLRLFLAGTQLKQTVVSVLGPDLWITKQ